MNTIKLIPPKNIRISYEIPVTPLDPSWPQPLKVLESAIIDLVNLHRTGLGLHSMGTMFTLTNSAEWKASNEANYMYFDHDDEPPPVTRTWIDRILSFGYLGGQYAAENMAETLDVRETPEQVVAMWLNSDAHRQNIETPAWTVTGVGVASNRISKATFWVQDFGVGTPDVVGPPVPTPNKLDAWVKTSLPMLLASSYFKKYKRDHPTEAAAILSFVGNTTVDPQVETLFGHFLGSTIENLAN